MKKYITAAIFAGSLALTSCSDSKAPSVIERLSFSEEERYIMNTYENQFSLENAKRLYNQGVDPEVALAYVKRPMSSNHPSVDMKKTNFILALDSDGYEPSIVNAYHEDVGLVDIVELYGLYTPEEINPYIDLIQSHTSYRPVHFAKQSLDLGRSLETVDKTFIRLKTMEEAE